MVFANPSAWLSLLKPMEPLAPPRLMVTIFPALWHVSMSGPRKLQSGSCVPSNTGSLDVLHVCKGEAISRVVSGSHQEGERATDVGQVDGWLSTLAKEDVQESDRDCVDDVILCGGDVTRIKITTHTTDLTIVRYILLPTRLGASASPV